MLLHLLINYKTSFRAKKRDKTQKTRYLISFIVVVVVLAELLYLYLLLVVVSCMYLTDFRIYVVCYLLIHGRVVLPLVYFMIVMIQTTLESNETNTLPFIHTHDILCT